MSRIGVYHKWYNIHHKENDVEQIVYHICPVICIPHLIYNIKYTSFEQILLSSLSKPMSCAAPEFPAELASSRNSGTTAPLFKSAALDIVHFHF